MPKNRIIPQMFDVRPVKDTGGLDWEKIRKVAGNYPAPKKNIKPAVLRHPKIFILGQKFESRDFPIFSAPAEVLCPVKAKIEESKTEKIISAEKTAPQKPKVGKNYLKKLFQKAVFFFKEIIDWPIKFILSWVEFFRSVFLSEKNLAFGSVRDLISFSIVCLLITFVIGTTAYWNKGVIIRGKVLGVSQEGYENINVAMDYLRKSDYENSAVSFDQAYNRFDEASKELNQIGETLISFSQYLPFVSRLSSGSNVIEAGKYLSAAGEDLSRTSQKISLLKKAENLESIPLLILFRETEGYLKQAQENLKRADEYLKKVNIDDLPEDKKGKFITLKTMLPEVVDLVDSFLGNEHIFTDLLGGNGPRKYLFLFQNNQEMRATGGFIGSYGILDIANGRIRKFFIDGIFDPDGQLKEKIIPPVPIQKISAAWSLHDSNWFPDFPTSAKKAILFYEKTGGPTTDGVITLTPTVLEKLLEITGPVEMEDYGVTLDSKNFIEKTQYEVEMDYDKEENEPKKILADLAPLILDKLFSSQDLKTSIRALDVLVEALNQKHILVYSQNKDLQKIISERGWSGEILETSKDYLSVINTNINGFKTDGIIDEKIEHQAEIKDDGSVVDAVTITRHHNGGNTGYEWWDKVNADYLRVYVPLGSKFLSVEGQTREFNKPPLDYDALNFKKDPQVEKEEAGMEIDEASGTRIYEDSGKTVFANWTYVSPQETMVLKYTYRLPFKVAFADPDKLADSYGILIQKQSGSLGSAFSETLAFPRKYKVLWQYPEELQMSENKIQFQADLATDKFIGISFAEKNLITNQ